MGILSNATQKHNQEIVDLEKSVKDITSEIQQTARKLDKSMKMQKLLGTRVEKLLRIINSHQSRLSIAEKQFHKELSDKQSKLPELQMQLKEVKSKQIIF